MQEFIKIDQNAVTYKLSNPDDSFSIAAVRKRIVGVIHPDS